MQIKQTKIIGYMGSLHSLPIFQEKFFSVCICQFWKRAKYGFLSSFYNEFLGKWGRNGHSKNRRASATYYLCNFVGYGIGFCHNNSKAMALHQNFVIICIHRSIAILSNSWAPVLVDMFCQKGFPTFEENPKIIVKLRLKGQTPVPITQVLPPPHKKERDLE